MTNIPQPHSELQHQFAGYRLLTAEIIYHLPDHPDLLQSYIWQDYDLLPKFPVLRKFLDFWSRDIEGKLHSVKFSHKSLVSAQEMAYFPQEFTLQ